MPTLLRLAQRSLLVAAALLALASTGCAARPRRAVMIDTYASAYVHHHPPAEVAAMVERMLRERGFDVLPTRQGEAIRTEWKDHLGGDEEFATAVERYIVIVHRLTREHTRVTAMRLRFSTAGMETYHPTTPLRSDGKGHSVNTATYGKGWMPLMIGKPESSRDVAFEWELIRRLDPSRARMIERMVDFELARPPSQARASR